MEKWEQLAFRPGAAAFSIDNEASVFYCFDEGNRKTLTKALADEGDEQNPKTLERLAKKRLLVSFGVPRDMPTFGWVALGSPVNPQERGDGDWRPAQSAALSLPSGLLRLETALSYSLCKEILPEDDGAFVEVPPGDYQLTFVVAEFGQKDRPRVYLTLEPLSGQPTDSPIVVRPAPPPLPKNSKLGQYTVDDEVFSGRWQFTQTNFDKNAARRMGLAFGDRLRFASKTGTYDAWFLGRFGDRNVNLAISDYFMMTNGCSGYVDDLFCGWHGAEEAQSWDTLRVFRFAETPGKPAIPKFDDSSIQCDYVVVSKNEPVAVTKLPEKLRLDAAPEADESLKEGALHARFLTWSPSVVTLNVSIGTVLRTGGAMGKVYDLEVAGQTRRMLLVRSESKKRPKTRLLEVRSLMYFNGDLLVDALLGLKESEQLPDDVVSSLTADEKVQVNARRFAEWDQGRLLNLVGPRTKKFLAAAQLDQTMVVPRLEMTDTPLLLATACPHWKDPEREILWIESGAYRRVAREEIDPALVVPHGIPEATDGNVTIRFRDS